MPPPSPRRDGPLHGPADVVETVRKIIETWPEDEDGFVVALPAQHNNPIARVRFFMNLHITPDRTTVTASIEIRDATIYADFAEASRMAELATQHWGQPEGIRILKIRRRKPFVLLKDYPITLLDALAEL